MHLHRRSTCRVCGSKALRPAIDLGEQHLQGSFMKDGVPAPPQRKLPTSIVRCDPMHDEHACGLLQTEYTVPPDILYSVYWYRSGTNATMREHLRQIAEDVVAAAGLRPDATVMDIGCNDGTLLSAYPPGMRRIGVDPSNIAQKTDESIEIVRDFFPCLAVETAVGDRKCDAITSIAMFYDLEDPVTFVKAVKALLVPDGVWCFEMAYMPAMLRQTSYDTICHEHIEYYSLTVIERILAMAGMKVFDVSENSSNGGSLRCYACLSESPRKRTERVSRMRLSEFDLGLETDKPYAEFQERANVHRHELKSLLKNLKASGARIHVYGASTKGNTILQWCGIDGRLVEAAADRNPDKWGARTIGSEIPIISEESSREQKPDYYLVLPWHFRDEFLKRERPAMDLGTKLIFPLPAIEICK